MPRSITTCRTLFGVHVVAFLSLVLTAGSLEHEQAVWLLALGDLSALLERPWSLLTYVFVTVHPLDFVLASGVLFLVGPALEEKHGAAGFLGIYVGSALMVACAHLLLVESGQLSGLLNGGLGASAGLLTAYLFSVGTRTSLGSMPFPGVYLLLVSAFLLTSWVVHSKRSSQLELAAKEIEHLAIAGTDRTQAQRLSDLERASRLQATRPETASHLLGLCFGFLALCAARGSERAHERYQLKREIDTLQAEVDARARVEELLAKISAEGIESLSRNERRFLCYASRFYRGTTANAL